MKILLTGDWHLDWITEGIRRYNDIECKIWEIVDYAKEIKVDYFVFLGDLCNPNTSRSHRSIACAINVARSLEFDGIKSLWITGNHDVIEDGSGDHTLMALSEAGFLVYDRPNSEIITSVDSSQDMLVIALPYTSMVNDYDSAEFMSSCANHYRDRSKRMPVLVIGHLHIEGMIPGSENIEMSRGRIVVWPIRMIMDLFPNAIVAGGHYHKGDPSGKILIPGSLARLTFGESDNELGIIVVEGGKCNV